MMEHILDLGFGETKLTRETLIHHGIDVGVVHLGEDGFLGYLRHARQHNEEDVGIAFGKGGIEFAEKGDGLLKIAMLESAGKRGIVLVHQNHDG